jgi:hypothetical protein
MQKPRTPEHCAGLLGSNRGEPMTCRVTNEVGDESAAASRLVQTESGEPQLRGESQGSPVPLGGTSGAGGKTRHLLRGPFEGYST